MNQNLTKKDISKPKSIYLVCQNLLWIGQEVQPIDRQTDLSRRLYPQRPQPSLIEKTRHVRPTITTFTSTCIHTFTTPKALFRR